MTTFKRIALAIFLGLPVMSGAATVSFSGANVSDQEVTGTASDFVFNLDAPNRGAGGYTTNVGQTNTAKFDNQNHTGLQGEPLAVGKQTWNITVNPGELLNLSFSGTVSDFFQWGSRPNQSTGRGDFSVLASGSPLPAASRNTSAVFNDPRAIGLESRLFTDEFSWSNIAAGTYSFNVSGNRVNDYTVTTGVRDSDAPAGVPVPAAIWLMGSGLLGLMSLTKKKKA